MAAIRNHGKTHREIEDLKSLLADGETDDEMRALAQLDLPELEEQMQKLEQDMQVNAAAQGCSADNKSAILEIRAGDGRIRGSAFRRRSFPHV